MLVASVWCRAEENFSPVQTSLSSTVISGYVDSSAEWNLGSQIQDVPEPSTLGLLAVGAAGVVWLFGRRRRSRRR